MVSRSRIRLILLCRFFFFLFVTAQYFSSAEAHEQDFAGCSAGTKVKTDKGYTPIEQIQENDVVQTYNLLRFFSMTDRVQQIKKKTDQEVLELVVNNRSMFVSPDQQFYAAGANKWIKARDLKPGDTIKTYSGELPVGEVRAAKQRMALYCLAMKKNHNFFVTDNDLLVHNMALAGIFEAIGAWFVKEKVVETVTYGTIAYAYNQQKKEFEQQQKIYEQFDIVGTDLAPIHRGQDLPVILPPETTNNHRENTIGNRPSPAPANQNRSIDRSINSMDRIKPGHGNSITLGSRPKLSQQERDKLWADENLRQQKLAEERRVAAEKERIFQENLKTWPHTKTTVETIHKGWFWNSVSKKEHYTLIKNEKYLENKNNPKQVATDGDVTTTVEYILPDASPLAQEEKQKAAIGQVVNNVVEFVAGKKDKDIGDFSLHNSEAQDKEERDLTGAQAPGKPTAEDGYYPPKKWDGKKVQVQGGPLRGKSGWPDRDGKIWVPTGPKGHPLAHGGPHWDVQYPNGSGHENKEPKIKKQSMDSLSQSSISNDAYYSIPYEERYKNVLKGMIEDYKNIDEIRARDKATIEEVESQMTEEEKQEYWRHAAEFISTIKTPPAENCTSDDAPRSEEVRELEKKIEELQKKEEEKSQPKIGVVEFSPEAKSIFLDSIGKNNTPIFVNGTRI